MPWVSMSDDVSENGKVIEAGVLAEMLWRRSIEWSNRHLKDGLIPSRKVRSLVDWTGIFERSEDGRLLADFEQADASVLAERLVSAGLWERVEGGFQIHDYLHYQPSRKEVLQERRRVQKQRSKAGRASAQKRWAGPNGSGNGSGNGPVTGVVTGAQREC